MAINCSSNSALEALNAKKEALAGKIGELKAAGAAAMGDLKAKADEMKDSLLAALPDPPEFPNFKKELAELQGKVGKELADAKAAFKERWGKAMPDVDIDGLMEKVAVVQDLVENFEENAIDLATGLAKKAADKFDFCKDVPNVEAPKVDANGVVEQVKVKAEEPTVAADIPVKVEVVEPTVVAKEKEPSVSYTVKKPVDELARARENMRMSVKRFLSKYTHGRTTADNKLKEKKREKWYSKVSKKAGKKGLTLIEYYNSGSAKSGDKTEIREYIIVETYKYNMNLVVQNIMAVNRAFSSHGSGEAFNSALALIKDKLSKSTRVVSEKGDSISINTGESYEKVLQEYADLLKEHEEIISDLEKYKR